MNRGRIQEFTGTGMVCPWSMMSIAPSSKTQLTQETKCRDAVGGAEMGTGQDIRQCPHWLFWLLSRNDGQGRIYVGPSRVGCRQYLLQVTVPPGWVWLQSEATSLLLKSDSFHKEGTVLEWCLLPSDRIILARSVWEGRCLFGVFGKSVLKGCVYASVICKIMLAIIDKLLRDGLMTSNVCIPGYSQLCLANKDRTLLYTKAPKTSKKSFQCGVSLSIKEGKKSKLVYDSSSVICSNLLRPIFQIALLRKSRRKRRKREAPVSRLFTFTWKLTGYKEPQCTSHNQECSFGTPAY